MPASPTRTTARTWCRGGVTQGGYSDTIVVDDHFVLRLPATLLPAAAAPLLCAGITTWSPLTHWGTGPGTRVGVVGIGGLGHMAVKLAAAMGAEVVAITRSAAKAAEARRLGAHDAVVATEAGALKAHRGALDLIIDTVGTGHDLEPLVGLLRMHGTLCLVGGAPDPHSAVRAFSGPMWAEAGAAPSSRCSHSRWPPSSTMAMVTAQWLRRASASAAAAIFFTSSAPRTILLCMRGSSVVNEKALRILTRCTPGEAPARVATE